MQSAPACCILFQAPACKANCRLAGFLECWRRAFHAPATTAERYFPNSVVRTRVLVGFLEITGGPQKCTRILPAKECKCDLGWNYNGLSAIASIHVHFSKELQWFELPPKVCKFDSARNYNCLSNIWSLPGGSSETKLFIMFARSAKGALVLHSQL